MDIYFNHRSWYIIVCICTALVYAVFLYIKNIRSDEYKRWIIILLFITRFSLVFLLCLFLLEPVFKKETKKVEKPIIVFAQDNSESILINKDSSYYKGEYTDSVRTLISKLKKSFDVHTFSFGTNVQSELSFDYRENTTDFGKLFEEINARYYGRNLGAVIIASDGIVNTGVNPLYADLGIDQTVLYALSLGDTNYQKDASIQKIQCNKIVGLGNEFPVDIHVVSKKMIGSKLKIKLFKENEQIDVKEIEIKEEIEAETIKFIINADKPGKIKYDVHLSEIEGELTYINNKHSFYVDVLDDLQKVLILANAPHPDIAAIKWAIGDKLKREIDVLLLNDFKDEIDEYDLIILHRTYVSDNAKIANLIKTTRTAKIPILHITGSQITPNFYNELNLGVQIERHQGKIDAMPIINPVFSSFIVNKQMIDQIENYPPLAVPFVAEYKSSISNSIMINQQINGESTDYPMIVLTEHADVREGLIFGEGIWRWKMMEFLEKNNGKVFKSIFSKITQFLISTDKKDRFEIEIEHDFNENDPIQFYGEFYNKNFEMILDAEIEIDIVNDSGDLFNKVMINNGSNYELLINKLEPGKYEYTARTKYGKENFEEKGSFNIHEVRLEMLNSKADFTYLNQLVNSYNGAVFSKENMNELYHLINNEKDLVSVSHLTTKLDDLIKWKWLFFIISMLLFLEWFSRKRTGLY